MSGSDRSHRQAAADIRRGLSFIDEAFERARERDGIHLPCRRGCSSCCAAVFDLHEADAVLLRDWLARQPSERRRDVGERALRVLGAALRAARRLAERGFNELADWTPDEGLGALPGATVTRLAGAVSEPCPLLGDAGECLAHVDRPALCRLQGLPWRDPASGEQLPDACRLEPGMAVNEPQELDLGRLDGLRHDVAEAMRDGDERPRRRFVAEVLVAALEALEGAPRGQGNALGRRSGACYPRARPILERQVPSEP